ncbi:MAG: hypothetical protein JW821_05695 [Deltaproteobacteria bacterium]|nr:hypothetical protein [Deltaproteobacteria bacterium]
MVEDFEKDEPFSITTKRSPGKYPSTEDMDHLTYLEERLSVFTHEKDDRIGEWRLVCASCGGLVTRVSERIEVRGRHNHDFPYYNNIVRLGCYRNAPGCVGIDRISNGYSWFRGYAWQIQLCRNCSMQLGWKYMSPDESFYGLVFKLLREEKPGDSNGAAS